MHLLIVNLQLLFLILFILVITTVQFIYIHYEVYKPLHSLKGLIKYLLMQNGRILVETFSKSIQL